MQHSTLSSLLSQQYSTRYPSAIYSKRTHSTIREHILYSNNRRTHSILNSIPLLYQYMMQHRMCSLIVECVLLLSLLSQQYSTRYPSAIYSKRTHSTIRKTQYMMQHRMCSLIVECVLLLSLLSQQYSTRYPSAICSKRTHSTIRKTHSILKQ